MRLSVSFLTVSNAKVGLVIIFKMIAVLEGSWKLVLETSKIWKLIILIRGKSLRTVLSCLYKQLS